MGDIQDGVMNMNDLNMNDLVFAVTAYDWAWSTLAMKCGVGSFTSLATANSFTILRAILV